MVIWPEGTRAFIRGGNWNNGTNTGVLTLNLNNAPSSTNAYIGFRASRDNIGRREPVKARYVKTRVFASVPL